MNDSRTRPLAAALLAMATALAAPAGAEAQSVEGAEDQSTEVPESQSAASSANAPTTSAHRQTTGERPFYLSFGVGPSFGLDSGASAKLKLQQEVGYHFLPLGDHPGVFAGVTLAQSYIDFTILQLGGRVGADFAIMETDSFRLLVTPSIAIGVGMYVVASSVIGTEVRTLFNLQLAGDVKVEILDGKLALWVRPIGLDFFFNGGSLERYDLLFGVQINL